MRQLWQPVDSALEALWSPEPIAAVQEFFGPGWEWFFNAVTILGTIYAIAVVISLALWLGGRRLAYGLVGAVLLATATNALLWTLVGVPRPDDPDVIVRAHLGVSSFPSGHTVIATVLWGSLAKFSRVLVAIPVLVVPAVMLSRLYLGAHYPGDVLGGALIGLLLVVAYARLRPAIMRRFSRLPVWLFLILGLCAPFAVLFFVGPSSRGWELFGVAMAAGIGLPLEYRYVGFEPVKATFRRQALKVSIGLGGMAPLLLARGLFGGDQALLDTTLLVLAVLWGVLVAPAMFTYLGLSQRPARRR